MTFLAPSVPEFLRGKWLEFCSSPTTGSFHPIFFAMTFFWHRDLRYLKTIQFGAAGGLEWRFSGEK